MSFVIFWISFDNFWSSFGNIWSSFDNFWRSFDNFRTCLVTRLCCSCYLQNLVCTQCFIEYHRSMNFSDPMSYTMSETVTKPDRFITSIWFGTLSPSSSSILAVYHYYLAILVAIRVVHKGYVIPHTDSACAFR